MSIRRHWPNEKDLKEIRDRLSSDRIEGSLFLGKDAPLPDRIKQELCSKIVEYHVTHKTSQKKLAEKLGIDEPEMSRILHYRIGRYSIERLIGYLEILYPKLSVKLLAA